LLPVIGLLLFGMAGTVPTLTSELAVSGSINSSNGQAFQLAADTPTNTPTNTPVPSTPTATNTPRRFPSAASSRRSTIRFAQRGFFCPVNIVIQ
jgi:hypothetical protein